MTAAWRPDPVGLVGAWGLLGAAAGLAVDLLPASVVAADLSLAAPGTWTGVGVGLVASWSLRGADGQGWPAITARWAPVGLAIPVVLVLGVLGTVALEDATAAAVAVPCAGALAAFAWRGLGREVLARAVVRWSVDGSTAGLERVAAGPWTPAVRAAAWHGLAMDALRAGAAGAAVAHLDRVRSGALDDEVAVARALLAAVGDAPADADAWLGRVSPRRRSGALEARADAVRLLIATRARHPDAAALAERLVARPCAALTRGLAAWHRWHAGDLDGAFSLLDPIGRREVAIAGLPALVREVREVLEAVPGTGP